MNAGNEKLFTAVKPFKIIQTTENSINVIFLNIIIFVRGGHCKYSPLAPHPPQKKKAMPPQSCIRYRPLQTHNDICGKVLWFNVAYLE